MYPIFRLTKEFIKFRKASPLSITGVHTSEHICWPWDLDLWMELNNGRTLTLYDLGRLIFAKRTGLISVLKRERWGLTMAGASVRYRRRVRMFDRITMHSRLAGWDQRFVYLEQSMWKGGECTSHILYRSAITDSNGIVGTHRITVALGYDGPDLGMPDWVKAWSDADALRPWPPTTQ